MKTGSYRNVEPARNEKRGFGKVQNTVADNPTLREDSFDWSQAEMCGHRS